MDPQIASALINSGTTIFVSGFLYFIINNYMNKQRNKLDQYLARINPSHNPVFEDNREYLRILKNIKDKFFDIYFNDQKRPLIF